MPNPQAQAPAPWSAARWPNFTRDEISCPHCGKLLINEKALDALQKLRNLLGKPVKVNSAYRCSVHNKVVDGAKASKHLTGEGFDIDVGSHDRRRLYWTAQVAGFKGFGFMRNALHVDMRPSFAAWNYGPESVNSWTGIIPAGTKKTGS